MGMILVRVTLAFVLGGVVGVISGQTFVSGVPGPQEEASVTDPHHLHPPGVEIVTTPTGLPAIGKKTDRHVPEHLQRDAMNAMHREIGRLTAELKRCEFMRQEAERSLLLLKDSQEDFNALADDDGTVMGILVDLQGQMTQTELDACLSAHRLWKKQYDTFNERVNAFHALDERDQDPFIQQDLDRERDRLHELWRKTLVDILGPDRAATALGD